MNEKKLGKVVFIEQQTASGTAGLVVLAKMDQVVLLDVSQTIPAAPGAPVMKEYAFAPVGKGASVRFDRYDASTGELTQGNDAIIEFEEPDGMLDASGGSKTYPNITKEKKDKMLLALQNAGMRVTGNNPWSVDVGQHGIKLQGAWNEAKQELTIKITDKNWYVPDSKIWATIDPLIHNL